MALSLSQETRQNLASAGTAQALGTGRFKDVVLQADPGNAGTIYIGDENVDSTNGYALTASQAISLNALFSDSRTPDMLWDLSTIYFDGTDAGDDVRIITVNFSGPRNSSNG